MSDGHSDSGEAPSSVSALIGTFGKVLRVIVDAPSEGPDANQKPAGLFVGSFINVVGDGDEACRLTAPLVLC